jgi:hypothetical protein
VKLSYTILNHGKDMILDHGKGMILDPGKGTVLTHTISIIGTQT